MPGTTRIRRVLALRPAGARPTESLLETLMIQPIRDVPSLPEPVRQQEIRVGAFTFRLDISRLDLGLFLDSTASTTLISPFMTRAGRRPCGRGCGHWLALWSLHLAGGCPCAGNHEAPPGGRGRSGPVQAADQRVSQVETLSAPRRLVPRRQARCAPLASQPRGRASRTPRSARRCRRRQPDGGMPSPASTGPRRASRATG